MILYIEDLLHKHDFVIIPGFGGFVATKECAYEINDVLYPPKKSIGFNPNLLYNDGLLAHKYVAAERITYDEANIKIAESVKQINDLLEDFKHLNFGIIGTFHKTETGLAFEPSEENPFMSSSFGLLSFYFPKLENKTVQPTTIQKAQKVEFTPAENAKVENKFSRHSSRFVGAVAAIILLFMFFPTNVEDRGISYQASFVPPTVNTITEQLTEEQNTPCTPYHIIVGSFYTQVKANQFISEIKEEIGDLQIIYSENRFRISCTSFETEEESNTFLDSFVVNHPRYADAWVLNYNP
ncbi:MAG: hypothetical protein EOL95_06430 [Bacteroidia bacterium]|nr:hypothetical protein [Bacteroidia bacterium]